jgi:hypothetical protein
MRLSAVPCLSIIASVGIIACSGSGSALPAPQTTGTNISGSSGGATGQGGSTTQVGSTTQGGAAENGGNAQQGGDSSNEGVGGVASTGGKTSATGGKTSATGGKTSSTGTVANVGGIVNVGGSSTASSTASQGGSTSPAGGQVSTGGAAATGGSVAASTCADVVPQGTPCATWKDWGQCGSSWFITSHFCENTCGTCSGSSVSTGGASGTGGTNATGGTTSAAGGNSPTGGSSSSANPSTSYSTSTNPQITGSTGYATRYWDCCMPSCSWTTNVPYCDSNGTTKHTGAGSSTKSGCDSGGSAYECYDFSPWYDAATNTSYGFVAHNNVTCGTCYELQFTGAGHDGTNPGATAIKGRQMIVQVINIGGIANDQFDVLIPGGGVGAMTQGCKAQWGSSTDLGATYGGLYTNSGGSCSTMRSKCQSVFGNFPSLLAGCYWFTDWYNCADNPVVTYKQVNCPSQITGKSGISVSAH